MFSDPTVIARLEELDVILIKADNTAKDQVIWDDLARYGRVNLPTNIVFPADPTLPGIIMPETISVEDALKALEKALEKAEE